MYEYDDDDDGAFPETYHVKSGGGVVRGRGLTERHPLADPALIVEFLDQRKVWCSTGLMYLAIPEMTPAHALATVNYVLKRAQYAMLVLLAANAPDVNLGHVTSEQSALSYIFHTPLVESLLERGRSGSDVPWAAVAAKS